MSPEDLEELYACFPSLRPKGKNPPEEDHGDDAEVFLASLPRKPAPAVAPSAFGPSAMPEILARSLSQTLTAGWQYNPRSDRHSVIKCWGTLLDLVRASPALKQALKHRRLVFGINSKVEGKALDLVIGHPALWEATALPRTFANFAEQYALSLTAQDVDDVQSLNGCQEGRVGGEPLLALEAKAIMTDHGGALPTLSDQLERFRNRTQAPLLAIEAKAVMTDHAGALPRLSDELERFRSRLGPQTLSVALVMVNVADMFISPGRNEFDPHRALMETSRHRQPHDAARVLQMLETLPLKPARTDGFDAIGTVLVDCSNDPSKGVTLRPTEGPLSYPAMIANLASQLATRI